MSGVDVIELGSSDEEVQEPLPKKAKPRPNAMVQFPSKIHGVSVNRSEPTVSKRNQMKNNVPKLKVINPVGVIGRIKSNSLPPPPKNIKGNDFNSPLQISKLNMKKVLQKGQIQTKPITVRPNQQIKVFPNPIKIQNTITNLPPGITVKRTKPMNANQGFAKRKRIVKDQSIVQVDLDEDIPNADPLATGPQWYKRPEELTEEINEEENKKKTEPEKPKYIEITIEDSPVKPKSQKNASPGFELPIFIEDSPSKVTPSKKSTSRRNSEDTPQNKHIRKMLQYPSNVVEVEIELETNDHPFTAEKDSSKETDQAIIEVEESPLKIPDEVLQSPKKVQSPPPKIPILKEIEDVISIEEESESSEFHPVYQSFIDLCFKLENSEDMKKIVEKKIKAYYRQVPKKYTESEEFIDMVSSKIVSITASPDKMYLYIKDIVDELNMQRKMAKNVVENPEEEEKKQEAQTFLYGEDSQFDARRQRQIRKLEKTIKKLHRAIQKLEEQEVDFDDEDDSVYLLTERYKERMLKVHAKFCQLTNTKMPSEPRIHLGSTPGKPSGAARKLEKWINRRVPIGAPLPFPDFHDVLRCVREANQEDHLGWNEADIMEEARNLFVRCGKKLQRRRQENEWRLASYRLSVDIDPAEQSEQLNRKLEENRKTATIKETEVFNKYADRQNQLKLEGEEIGDKEAEESPVDSEEDEVIEEDVALDKEKRKERLKRLIHEKTSSNKENNDATQAATNVKVKETQGNNETEATQVEVPVVTVDSNLTESNNDHIDTSKNNVSITDNVDLDSDIDELHLLQKLHSGNEANSSSSEFSDSASPISISDTLESESDFGNGDIDDVISIENSSFSEAEASKDDKTDENKIICYSLENKADETNVSGSNKSNEDLENESTPIESVLSQKLAELRKSTEVKDYIKNDLKASNTNSKYNNKDCQLIDGILLSSEDEQTDPEIKQTNKKNVTHRDNVMCGSKSALKDKDIPMELEENETNSCDVRSPENQKATKSTEDLLLASSGDDTNQGADNDGCFNLKDDAISIGDTTVTDQLNDKSDMKNLDGSCKVQEKDVIDDHQTNQQLDTSSSPSEPLEEALDKEIDNLSKKHTTLAKPITLIEKKSTESEKVKDDMMNDLKVLNNNPKDNKDTQFIDGILLSSEDEQTNQEIEQIKQTSVSHEDNLICGGKSALEDKNVEMEIEDNEPYSCDLRSSEYQKATKSTEDLLLASIEVGSNKGVDNDGCLNLNDGTISISDTTIEDKNMADAADHSEEKSAKKDLDESVKVQEKHVINDHQRNKPSDTEESPPSKPRDKEIDNLSEEHNILAKPIASIEKKSFESMTTDDNVQESAKSDAGIQKSSNCTDLNTSQTKNKLDSRTEDQSLCNDSINANKSNDKCEDTLRPYTTDSSNNIQNVSNNISNTNSEKITESAVNTLNL